jgi:hypothetical protein
MRGRIELAGTLILAGKRLRVKDEELGLIHKARSISGDSHNLEKSFTPNLLAAMAWYAFAGG